MSEPVAYMRVNTWVTPDSPNGPAEYDQEIELIPSGELSDYAGWIPLYAAPLQQEADKDGERHRAMRAQFEGRKVSVLLPHVYAPEYLPGVTYNSGEAYDAAIDAAIAALPSDKKGKL